MTISRNAPCPCGSGKKYKHCCMAKDRAEQSAAWRSDAGLPGTSDGAAREAVADAALRSRYWEVDAVALPIKFRDDEHANPVLVIVTAEGFVVHHDVLRSASPEPDDVARLLAKAVDKSASMAGGYPPEVHVRHQALAEALAAELSEHDVDVKVMALLLEVEEARQSLTAKLSPASTTLAVAMPQTWTAWGLPRQDVAAMFTAAADYYRAEPWRSLSNLQPLQATTQDGARWWVTVMGAGGLEYGLVVFASEMDLLSSLGYGTDDVADAVFIDQVVSLTFESRREIQKPMLRDIERGRWEIAGPSAYPSLYAINTPAGGVSTRLARDLTAILSATSDFTELHQDAVAGEEPPPEPLEWTDPETAVTLRYDGPVAEF